MDKLERLVVQAGRANDCVVWVYLFDRLNYRYVVTCHPSAFLTEAEIDDVTITKSGRFLMFFIVVFLILSTGGGVAYGVWLDDVSAGLTISTYVIGFIGIVTALWGAGEQLGVEKPDSYSYSFDTVFAELLHDKDGNVVDDAKGPK